MTEPSDSGLLWTVNDAFASLSSWRAMNSSPVWLSWRTRFLWANVPRSESCPVIRIGVPSFNIDANASASPSDHSTLRSSVNTFARFSRIRFSLPNTWKSFGQLINSSFSFLNTSNSTDVSTAGKPLDTGSGSSISWIVCSFFEGTFL